MEAFWVIAVLLTVVFISIYWENLITLPEYLIWKRKMKDTHNHSEESIRESLRQISLNSFEFHGESIPYGRAQWFISSEKAFHKNFQKVEFEYFGYSPIKSKNLEEFKEYGLLLTQYGLFEKVQIKKRETANVQFYPFATLWKVEIDSDGALIFYYPYGVIKKLHSNNCLQKSVGEFRKIISSGYTNDVELEKLNKKLIEIGRWNITDKTISNGTKIGFLSSFLLTMNAYFKKIQMNSIVSAPQGHGHAAEYANNVLDVLKHPFQEVKQVGQNNAPNGADRIVGNQNIQTKYHFNARSTVNSAFDSNADGGMYRYEGMQLEVPKEQYDECVKIMQEKIRDGKVRGVTNPSEAKNIIRKGNVTYKECKLIAKGGNLTSIKYDAIDGAIHCIPGVTLSFIIVFASAKWSGKSTQEAAKIATISGAKVLIIGTTIYTASQQVSKVFTAKINTAFGLNFKANQIAMKTGTALTIMVVVGPDLFRTLSGRISKEQFFKNMVVTGGGMIGGAVAGLAGGPIGAMIGAVVGSMGVKKIMDCFIEDDNVKMFGILKEEYIDLVMIMTLSENEFEELQWSIFNEKIEKFLKDMIRKKDSRKFARDFIEGEIERLLSKRMPVDESEILEAIEIEKNVFAA